MKMTDVRPGMRLRSVPRDVCAEEVEVTAVAPGAFTYRIPDDCPLVSPHWSMPLARDGHQHFGVGGEALFEPI